MDIIKEANELNRQSAQYLVDSGDTEVKAGVKTGNGWLKMGTEIDRRVALANQQAAGMEADALLLLPTDMNKAATILKEAATIRNKGVLEKYHAAQGLNVMLHLMGKKHHKSHKKSSKKSKRSKRKTLRKVKKLQKKLRKARKTIKSLRSSRH